MSFLLDTNIVSKYLKRPSSLAHRFDQYAGRLFLPTIVLAELYVGAFRHTDLIRCWVRSKRWSAMRLPSSTSTPIAPASSGRSGPNGSTWG